MGCQRAISRSDPLQLADAVVNVSMALKAEPIHLQWFRVVLVVREQLHVRLAANFAPVSLLEFPASEGSFYGFRSCDSLCTLTRGCVPSCRFDTFIRVQPPISPASAVVLLVVSADPRPLLSIVAQFADVRQAALVITISVKKIGSGRQDKPTFAARLCLCLVHRLSPSTANSNKKNRQARSDPRCRAVRLPEISKAARMRCGLLDRINGSGPVGAFE